MIQFIIIFTISSFINVMLNTIKTIIMYKNEKLSSSLANAVTYGFYTIVVVLMAGDMSLWLKVLITFVTNFFGVWWSMAILDKFKQDKLWEIVATTKRENLAEIRDYLSMHEISFNYNVTDNYKDTKIVFRIYSENQQQSIIIKKILKEYNAKYIVHEETVKL